VVLSGGPGAGKTTLLQALGDLGHATVPESARAVIVQRRAQGLPPRPAPLAFAREILRRDIRQHRRHSSADGWTFFDRGVVEALGMVDDLSPLPPDRLVRWLAAFAYHRQVFVLPPWPAIYTTDRERDQRFADAAQVHSRVVQWYARCGYRPVVVPRLTVPERCAFVLQALQHATD
jgi:predicted ATPase